MDTSFERFVRHGYNIRRETLDPMLRTIAAETPGVTFMPGSVVSDVVAEHNQVVGIRALQGSQPREVRARLVVAADGQASRVAEHAGLSARRTMPSPVAGFLRLCPLTPSSVRRLSLD